MDNDIFTQQENIYSNINEEYNNQNQNQNQNQMNTFEYQQLFEEGKLHILDNISEYNDKLNEYRYIETRSVIEEKSEKRKSIQTHILLHLENQMDIIQKNFEKTTHKQFDKSVYNNDEYKKKIEENLEHILGFTIQSFNEKTVIIENSIEDICNDIHILMNDLHDYIHHLHNIQYKINFISKYEKMDNEYNDLYKFSSLIDMYEKNIKDDLEEKIVEFIKIHTQKIHDKFNMIKLLQENLYQKVITKYSCGICLSNNIECYYTNCGHVICKSCGVKNRNINICPFCKRDGALKQLFFI
jgi:hypothetical protein